MLLSWGIVVSGWPNARTIGHWFDWWLIWEGQSTVGSTIPRQVDLSCIKMELRTNLEPRQRANNTSICNKSVSKQHGSIDSASVTAWSPAMMSLNGGLQPRIVRWDKSFPSQVAFGHCIYHSNRMKQRHGLRQKQLRWYPLFACHTLN